MSLPDPHSTLRARLCYATAYFLLPKYVAESPARLLEQFGRDPEYAARFFYVMACKLEEQEPVADDARAVGAAQR
jgi:hypothetical protein